MKIRTDFITNSSSSAFVALLDIELENGDKLTATTDLIIDGQTDEEYPPLQSDFRMESTDIESLNRIINKSIMVKGQILPIKSGSIRLICESYGEYGRNADPITMLSRYFGKVWDAIRYLLNKDCDDKTLVNELRDLDYFKNYTEDSLQTVVRISKQVKVEGITEVIQRLSDDGSIELEVKDKKQLYRNDKDSKKPNRKARLTYVMDTNEYESGMIGGRNCFGTKQEMQIIRLAQNQRYAQFFEQKKEEAKQSLKSYMSRVKYPVSRTWCTDETGYRLRDIKEFTEEDLNLDAKVSFIDRRFEIAKSSEDLFEFYDNISRDIMKRGGLTQKSNRNYVDENTDYLVISPYYYGEYNVTPDIRDAIKKNAEGKNVRIITDHQLWRAFDKYMPMITDEALDADLRRKREEEEKEEKLRFEERSREYEERSAQAILGYKKSREKLYDGCTDTNEAVDRALQPLKTIADKYELTIQEDAKQIAGMMKKDAERYSDGLHIKELIDKEVSITFNGKHFSMTGFSKAGFRETGTYGYKQLLIKEIEKRGGGFHSKVTSDTDYLIVDFGIDGLVRENYIIRMKKASPNMLLITEYQLLKAFETQLETGIEGMALY